MTRFISLLPFLLGVAFSSFAAYGVHYGRSPFVCDNSSVVNTLDCDSAVSLVRAEVRGAMKGIGERRGLSSSYWGLSLNFPADTVCVTLRHGNTDFGDLLDRRYTVVTLLWMETSYAQRMWAAFQRPLESIIHWLLNMMSLPARFVCRVARMRWLRFAYISWTLSALNCLHPFQCGRMGN